jgi:hypothetical protein
MEFTLTMRTLVLAYMGASLQLTRSFEIGQRIKKEALE